MSAQPQQPTRPSQPMTPPALSEENTVPSPTPASLPPWRLALLTLTLLTGLFLSLLDTSIVATALFSINASFHPSPNNPNPISVNWVALAYTLSYLAFAVLFARFSDIVGRRSAWTVAVTIFLAFSIGAGCAGSLEALVACRTLQGVGGAGLYSLTMVVLPEVASAKMLPMIAGLIGVVLAVAGLMGPVLGGALTGVTWRWIFWINLPIGVPALILFQLTWPREPQVQQTQRRRPWRDIDLLGGLLLVAASVLVVFSFQEGGMHATATFWRSALFLGPFIAGCFCWVLLFLWESRGSSYFSIVPLLPVKILGQRVYVSAVISTVATGFVYFVCIYSLPLHFQVVYGKSPLLAGVALLPMLASAAIGSALGGVLSGKKSRIFEVLVAATSLMALGAGLLSTLDNLTVQPKVYGFQIFVGLGFGLTASSVTMLAAVQSEQADTAVAQGTLAQARVLGGSIGIAASAVILGDVTRRDLVAAFGSENVPLQSAEALTNVDDPQVRGIVRQANVEGFSKIMWVTAILAVVALVAASGTYQRNPMSLRDMHEQRARKLQGDIASDGDGEKGGKPDQQV